MSQSDSLNIQQYLTHSETLHHSIIITLLFTILNIITLIPLILTLTKPHFDLHPTPLKISFEGHNRHTLDINLPPQFPTFLLGQ